MVQIVVALKYIVTDPDNPVNLADLPRDEAIQRIKEAYKDFARHIEVEIKGDMAFISYDEGEASSQESQADDYHSRGTRAARRGQYDIAITNFQKAIELQPDLVTARRDLAMAYMETGNTKAAKRQLVRVMQLQPNDAWAHTIMGNLYLHFEDDLGSAERYYQVAYDLDPDDVYLLNGYASLKAKRKQYQEAKELFERALTIDKNFPHARYALALLSQEQGEWETAAWELRQLLSAPPDPDPRTARVYDEGRRMYLYVNQKMAEAQHAELMQQLHEDIDAYTEGGRYPVVLEEDSTIDYPSIAQIAWVYRRSEHVIKYKPAAPSILPHLVAHEFEHIRMIDEAVGAHRNRLFTTTSDTEEYAQRSVSNDLAKLRQRGLDNAAIADVVGRWVKGLSAQLFNTPLDMTVEYRVFQERPYLCASQLTSLDATIREGAEGLDPSIQQMTPRRIWQANIAMNCAYAHFIDYLFDGATNYRELFRSSGQYHNGEKLFQLW